MLNRLRKSCLHKYFWLVVLFGSFAIQAEDLFACELMGSVDKTTCCCDQDMSKGCPMGGGCEVTDNNTVLSDSCCDVSVQYSVGLQILSASDTNQNFQLAMLEAPQPPPTPLAIVLTSLISNNPEPSGKTHFSPFLPSFGTATYLVTQRLRI